MPGVLYNPCNYSQDERTGNEHPSAVPTNNTDNCFRFQIYDLYNFSFPIISVQAAFLDDFSFFLSQRSNLLEVFQVYQGSHQR